MEAESFDNFNLEADESLPTAKVARMAMVYSGNPYFQFTDRRRD